MLTFEVIGGAFVVLLLAVLVSPSMARQRSSSAQ